MNHQIVAEHRKKGVAEILERNRRIYKIKVLTDNAKIIGKKGEIINCTDEFLMLSDKYSINAGMVVKEYEIQICSECGYEAMKDERNDEWYCPIHDE